MPNLEEYVKQSELDKKLTSKFISTMLDDGEQIQIDQYVKEEIVQGQFGKQLLITFVAGGQEKVLGRPYPLSTESLRFMQELIKARKTLPFIIKKGTGAKGFPIYFALAVDKKTTKE